MRKSTVVICKQGSEHTFVDMNNQDFVLMLPKLKMVLDGCGSCACSEVGTKLFAQLFKSKYETVCATSTIYSEKTENVAEGVKNENKSNIQTTFITIVKEVFATLLNICPTDEFLFNNLCFTILVCIELDDEFIVFSCGDGYILTDNGETIEFIKLDDGEYPKYYAYNYVQNIDCLQEYRDGVEFSIYHFSKPHYINVGVATDGLRFYNGLNTIEKNKLFVALKDGKMGKIGMLINRNEQIFKDDISICF